MTARGLALLAALCVTGAPAWAQPSLDELFEALRAAADVHSARAVEARIWARWSQSGDAGADALLARGVAEMEAGALPLAVQTFGRVIEVMPGFAEGWNKRATAYYLMGDLERSVLDVERTLALEPRHFGALGGLGLIFDQLDDDAGALDAYERALKVNPHLPHARARIDSLRQKVRGQKT